MEEIPGIDPGKYESALTKLKGCGVMAKSFSSGCLLLVCGTPGCGKTLLTKNLVDEGSKARPGWRWIPIHFDDFYPPDKRTKQVFRQHIIHHGASQKQKTLGVESFLLFEFSMDEY